MPETKAPFRAEHVGSLLRPKELLADRAAFDAGKLSMEALDEAADKAIDKAIGMQADLGFHALSDGEYRRGMFWGEFFQTLNGMEVSTPREGADGRNATTSPCPSSATTCPT